MSIFFWLGFLHKDYARFYTNTLLLIYPTSPVYKTYKSSFSSSFALLVLLKRRYYFYGVALHKISKFPGANVLWKRPKFPHQKIRWNYGIVRSVGFTLLASNQSDNIPHAHLGSRLITMFLVLERLSLSVWLTMFRFGVR